MSKTTNNFQLHISAIILYFEYLWWLGFETKFAFPDFKELFAEKKKFTPHQMERAIEETIAAHRKNPKQMEDPASHMARILGRYWAEELATYYGSAVCQPVPLARKVAYDEWFAMHRRAIDDEAQHQLILKLMAEEDAALAAI